MGVCRGADLARGAVGLLDAMGCVDTLSFGSECADITLLRAASRAVDDYTVRESLRANLLSGVSFASARQRAVEELDTRVASVLVAQRHARRRIYPRYR